ncbi:hypothetical protein ElyMa_003680700 [Elysia marginata]|uniref:Uncharacterized protein n=1 Tax=Elysia marginata TaxID=1093978 RepID=A0AAV4EYZ5_9GAST|nr:hypothetical protein ElyMa_003680700 [Elysia marginata]
MLSGVFQPWTNLVILLLLLFLSPKVTAQGTTGQRCVKPLMPSPITETTPVGTELLTVFADLDMTWRFELNPTLKQLTPYLQFNRSEPTDTSFVLSLAKPMDLEEIQGLVVWWYYLSLALPLFISDT